MIIARIYRDQNDYIKRYTIEGHANYDDYGRDIVCAAISVLSQTTLISLVKVCGVEENDISYSIEEETGFIDVKLPKSINKLILDKTQILLESLVVGINSVIESYPEYVALENGEV